MAMPSFDGALRHVAYGVLSLVGGILPGSIIGAVIGAASGSKTWGVGAAVVTVIIFGIGGFLYSLRGYRRSIEAEKSAKPEAH